MDIFSLIQFLIPVLHYCYLIDPFKDAPKRRTSARLLKDKDFFIKNLIFAATVFLIGFFQMLLGNPASILFCGTPLLFIVLIKVADCISGKFYKKHFALLIRGDFYAGKGFYAIFMSNVVIIFPIAIPPFLFWIFR